MKYKAELIKKEYILLIVYAIVMSFLCVGTSPILDYMDPDSQNFRLLGRALAAGQIAYVDIFDHKGPYIYFIEYLGALISPHSEIGLFLIEIVCYSINICFAYKIVKNFANKTIALISSMAFLGLSFNFFTFVTGNLTDSYSVTFQIVSLYLIVKYYVLSDEIEHPPVYMFLHAIMACCCGLMRPVNAGMWIPFGIVLAIRLLKNGKVKNFFENFASLLIGIIVGFMPAIIYGIKYSCIEDMWYGTIIANMKYSANAAETNKLGAFLKQFILAPEFLIVFLAIVSCVLVAKKYSEAKWFIVTFIMMFVGSLFFMNVSLRNDGQYNQLYMVFTLPALVFLIEIISKRLNRIILLSGIIIITLICNLQLVKQVTKYGVYHYHYDAACAMKVIMDENPGDKVLVTGTQSLYYNLTDTVSHIKYFIIYGHGLHYDVFPDAVEMQAGSILNGENDYVIVNYNDDGTIYGVSEIDEKIKTYLEENYSVAYQTAEGINTVMYARNNG